MAQETEGLREVCARFKADADEMFGVSTGDLTPNEEEAIAILEGLGTRWDDIRVGAEVVISMSPEPVREAYRDLLDRLRENGG